MYNKNKKQWQNIHFRVECSLGMSDKTKYKWCIVDILYILNGSRNVKLTLIKALTLILLKLVHYFSCKAVLIIFKVNFRVLLVMLPWQQSDFIFRTKIMFSCKLFTSCGYAFEIMSFLTFTDWSHSLPDFSWFIF